ncbi:MAG: DMT family transporter [Planctomycetota bacterium]
MKEPLDASAASLALMTAAFWGGIVVAVKFSEDTLPPIAVAAIRFALAGVFMWIWCRFRHLPLAPSRSELRPAVFVALLLLVQILLFNFAIHYSNTSHAVLLISTYVGWVAIIEHFFTKADQLTPRKVGGIGLAAVGVGLTVFGMGNGQTGVTETSSADLPTLFGDVLMLLSAFVLGIKIVFTKYAVARVEPNKLIFWHHWIGSSLFAMSSLLTEDLSQTAQYDVWTMPVILALLYQGLVVGRICFAVQAVLLQRHTATSIAVFGFATPLFGVLFALVFRGDPYSHWLLVAGVCVALGIYLVNRSSSQSRTDSESGRSV